KVVKGKRAKKGQKKRKREQREKKEKKEGKREKREKENKGGKKRGERERKPKGLVFLFVLLFFPLFLFPSFLQHFSPIFPLNGINFKIHAFRRPCHLEQVNYEEHINEVYFPSFFFLFFPFF